MRRPSPRQFLVVVVVLLSITAPAAAGGMAPAASDTGGVAATDGATAPPGTASSDATALRVEPVNASAAVGTTQTFDVVVEDASAGIGAYDLSVNLSNGTVADITSVTRVGSWGAGDVTFGPNNDSASVIAAFNGSDLSGTDVSILRVTVRGDAAGSAAVDVNVGQLADSVGDTYNVTGVTPATLDVSARSLSVSNLTAPAGVTRGDSLSVSATVENTNNVSVTETLTYRFDGTAVATRQVTLAAGASQRVSFSFDTTGVSPGTYSHGVYGRTDDATGTVTVADQPTELRVEPASASVSVNGSTTFDVVVSNASDGIGGYDLSVNLSNGTAADLASVTRVGSWGAGGVTFGPGNDSAHVTAGFNGSSLSGSNVSILRVTVEGDATGSTALELSVGQISDADGDAYTVVGTSPATVTVTDPSLTVSNLDAPANVSVAELVQVGATITNTGSTSESGVVTFRFDGVSVRTRQVTLAGGASQRVSFAFPAPRTPGTYSVGINTSGDAATAQVDVGTAVRVSPATGQTAPNGTQTFQVVVNHTLTGIGGYNLTVGLSNGTVADITSVTRVGSWGAGGVTLGPNNDSARAVASFNQSDLSGSNVSILNVTVEGAVAGTTDVEVTVTQLSDPNGNVYHIVRSAPAMLNVSQQIPTFPGQSGPATDPDNDGLYEDTSGDGQMALNDALIYFNNRNSATVQNNPSLFDFNPADTRVGSISDAISLFAEVT